MFQICKWNREKIHNYREGTELQHIEEMNYVFY